MKAVRVVAEEKCAVRWEELSGEMLMRAWYMDEDYVLRWLDFLHQYHDGFTWEQIKEHSAIVCKLFNWYRGRGFEE